MGTNKSYGGFRRLIGACMCVFIFAALFRGPDLSAYLQQQDGGSAQTYSFDEMKQVIFDSASALDKTKTLREHMTVSEQADDVIEKPSNAAPSTEDVARSTEQKLPIPDEVVEKPDPPKRKPAVEKAEPPSKQSELKSSFDEDLEAVRTGSFKPFEQHSMFGFLSTVCKQPKATLESINSIKTFMPDAPIYLCSSAGYHYEPLSKRFSNIHYTYDHLNAATWLPDHTYTNDDAKGLERWFERVKVAALWCNCTYLINMEDDTFLRQAILDKPEYDAGGVRNDGFHWVKELQEKFGADKWSYKSHGMCGGSYIRTEAFLEAYSRINWTRVADMSAIDRRIGFDPDVTLAMLMMDSGYTLQPWKDAGQQYHRGSTGAKILHNVKKYYNTPLDKFDGAVISDRLEHNESQTLIQKPKQDVARSAKTVTGLNKNFTKKSDTPKNTAVKGPKNSEQLSSFEADLEAVKIGNLTKFERHSLFGFMFTAHKQPKATLESVNSINAFMPAAPIYFCASAGYHYDPLARRFTNMHYVYDHINAATWLPQVRKTDDVRNLERWLERIKVAALWCNCDYLVYMEDDTFLRRPLLEKPEHDAGGLPHPDFHWVKGIQEKFGAGNWSYTSHGMCGGSYIRTEAFLDAYSRINWTRIDEMKSIDELIGRHSDITLAMLMMDSGYILRPWKEVARKYHRGSMEAKLLHAEKKYYDKPLNKFDGAVISDRLDRNESTRLGLAR